MQKGDSFGLMVTYFGVSQSTVVFLHNNEPIASRLAKFEKKLSNRYQNLIFIYSFKRYHFESDSSKFFPTITFENGPIEIEVVWQNAVEPHSLPSFIEV